MTREMKRIYKALCYKMENRKDCDNYFLLTNCIQFLTANHIRMLETGIAYKNGNRLQRRLFVSILRQTIKKTFKG